MEDLVSLLREDLLTHLIARARSDGEAEGRALGEARARSQILAILTAAVPRLIESGELSMSAARTQIDAYVAAGMISPEEGLKVLAGCAP